VDIAGAAPAHRNGLVCPVLPGSENRAKGPEGCRGTWEALRASLRTRAGGGDRLTHPRPAVGRPGPTGAKVQAHRRVASGEGNRVRRKGPRESHSAIVPWKSGNAPRRTRWREGRCRRTDLVGGTRRSPLRLQRLSPQPYGIASGVFGWPRERLNGRAANPSVDEPDALIAHVRICGSRGGQPPRRPGRFSPRSR
jgi:hypothetical protein